MAASEEPLRPEDLGIGALFWRVPDAVVVAAVETGRVVLWNPAAERLFGWAAAEAVGQCIEDVVVPDRLRGDHQVGLAQYQREGRGRLIDAGAPVEVPARRKDGTEVVVELTLSALDAAGLPGRYVLALIRDASPRKQAEADRARLVAAEAAAAERLMLEAVFQQMPAAVVIAEAPSGRIVYGNARVEELLGHPLPRLAGLEEYGAWRGFHADGRPYAPEEWPLARAIRHGEVVTEEEVEYLRGDGARAVLSVNAAPLRDAAAGIVGAVLACTDVTDQRRARERLSVLADASRVLAEAGLDAPALLDVLAGTAARTLGCGAAVRLLSPDGRWLVPAAAHHPDPVALAAMRAIMDAAPMAVAGAAGRVQAGEPLLVPVVTPADVRALFPPEYWPYHERFTIGSLVVVPLRARGRVLGTLGAVRTSADPPFTAEDLALLQDLGDRAGAAVDSARLYDEVRGAAALREQVIGAVSHDLRTPLTSIKGQAQVLRRQARRGAPDPARVDELLARIETGVNRMTSMLDELLDTARLHAGQPLELHRGDVDLVALLRRSAEEHAVAAPRHHIRVDAAAPSLVGQWDAARLARVLDNLLGNAVKYSPAGSEILLRVARDDAADGAWALLSVQDRGMGIPAADLVRVFEPFHRGANVAGRVPGTGLGLAGARRIVEQHGGTVTVESAEGVGSTFLVRLPLAAPWTAGGAGDNRPA